MKVLTGLMPASEGSARLLGNPVNAKDLATRKRVGFMSQSFSLYGELSVRQNLALHAKLFDLPKAESDERIDELIQRFNLQSLADQPCGDRKRAVEGKSGSVRVDLGGGSALKKKKKQTR